MASPFTYGVAIECRPWANVRAARITSNEFLCNGTMDGLSSVRTDNASDDDQLRHDDGVPTAYKLVTAGPWKRKRIREG
jgi:hypothetical protein